jgi:hypothetical protein
VCDVLGWAAAISEEPDKFILTAWSEASHLLSLAPALRSERLAKPNSWRCYEDFLPSP